MIRPPAMQVEVLGSGGAVATPRPGCICRICEQARQRGLPYSRGGPSVFVHGPNILIDTPEEIGSLLNRSAVHGIRACFYSHWHPDHTMGRRVWEMNFDWREWPPHNRCTDIFLPQQVARDFRERLGTYEHLEFFVKRGIIRIIELPDGQCVTIDGVRVTPIRLAEDYVYAFLFEQAGRRLLVAMDELYGWNPPSSLRGVDLAILPMGVLDVNPLTGQRIMAREHPILSHEATFQQTLELLRRIEPKQAILSHIEELGGLDYDDFAHVAERIKQQQGIALCFAHDMLRMAVEPQPIMAVERAI